MNSAKSLLGTGPFGNTPALGQRGKDVSLRMGSRFFVPVTASAVASLAHGALGSGYGFAFDSFGSIYGVINGSEVLGVGVTGLSVRSSARIGWGSGSASTSTDAFFMRQGAAVIQMGLDATSPTHQALKAHNGSGSNIAGANQILAGGAGTGTGRGGDVIHKTHESTTTGSTAQIAASVPRYQAVAKAFALTSGAAAATFCTFAVGSGKFIGCVVDCVLSVGNGTDYQALTTRLVISAVNKGGTITATIVQTDGTLAATGGSTLTPVTYSVVDGGGGNMALKLTATTNIGTPTMELRFVIVSYSGNGVESITAATLITPA